MTTIGHVEVKTMDRSTSDSSTVAITAPIAVVDWDLKMSAQEAKRHVMDGKKDLFSEIFELQGNFFQISFHRDNKEYRCYFTPRTSPSDIKGFVTFNNVGKVEFNDVILKNDWLYVNISPEVWEIKEPLNIKVHFMKLELKPRLEIDHYVISDSAKKLFELYRTKSPSDLIITVSGPGMTEPKSGVGVMELTEDKESLLKEFKVHKDVIEVQSEYFAKLKETKMEEYQNGKMTLSGVDPLVFELIVDFLYTEDIDFKKLDGSEFAVLRRKDFVLELYIVADRFIIGELKKELLKLIKETMTMQNIISRFHYARSTEMPELQKVCVDYLMTIPKCTKTAQFLSQCFGMVREDVSILIDVIDNE